MMVKLFKNYNLIHSTLQNFGLRGSLPQLLVSSLSDPTFRVRVASYLSSLHY